MTSPAFSLHWAAKEWARGRSTALIARDAGVPEHDVYNLLENIKALAKGQNASAVAAARAIDLGEQVTAAALCRVPPAGRTAER